MLVIKYEVVSQEEVFAALNSELIRAYVEAVIVPSKPERKTFAKIAAVLLDVRINMGRGDCRRTDFNPDEAYGRFPRVWIGGQQWLFLFVFLFLIATFEIGVRFMGGGGCSVGHFADNSSVP